MELSQQEGISNPSNSRNYIYIYIYIYDVKNRQWAARSSRALDNLCNKNKKDIAKSTDAVPAKYPPKVKLKNFYNSRVTTYKTQTKKNLTKSTDVIPAKYPSKVKLENFYNSRVLELR